MHPTPQPLPARRFGLLNYRALESVLTQYPDAKVRVLLVAPERANYYKYGNALPATQFEKYQKRGYDVGLQLVGEAELAALKQGVPGACVRGGGGYFGRFPVSQVNA